MTKTRRLLAIVAGLAVVAIIASSRSQGEPGQNPKGGPVVRPVVPVPERNVEKELAASKFDKDGAISYRTLKGDNLFPLQLKPQLAANHTRILRGPHFTALVEDWLTHRSSRQQLTRDTSERPAA